MHEMDGFALTRCVRADDHLSSQVDDADRHLAKTMALRFPAPHAGLLENIEHPGAAFLKACSR